MMERRRTGWACAAGLALVWPSGTTALRLEATRDLLAVEVVGVGLRGPSGVAADPLRGDIYVAEQEADRVCMLRNKEPLSVIEGPFPLAAASAARDPEAGAGGLRAPSALAFDAEGGLYVVESEGLARLLHFEPLGDGLLQARPIETPWVHTPHVCTSAAADPKGRLYITTQSRNRNAITVFGAVMMRDERGAWHLVDYGPFADFANVVVDAEGGTLVVGDRRSADLCWYDIRRQAEIKSLEQMEGLRHLALLKEGDTLVSLQRRDGTWSLAEVDPLTGRVSEWVGGLGEIGGLAVHPQTGDVYLTQRADGKVLKVCRLEMSRRMQMDQQVGRRLIRTFELQNAVPPPEWPVFFKDFIERLGLIRPISQSVSRERAAEGAPADVSMTMAEFASAVPVVAGKMKATLLSPSEEEADPIEEVSFLLFYPNRSMLTQQTMAPSLSLFWARHRSGRISRTQFMPNRKGRPLTEDLDWEDLPDMLVSFPTGYYAPETSLSDPDLVRLYFLGMGLGPDYWIDVYRDRVERSRMVVEHLAGRRADYSLEPFAEAVESGGMSVLVAGLKQVEAGWHALGREPIAWKIVRSDTPPVKTRHAVDWDRLRGAAVPIAPSVAENAEPGAPKPDSDLSRRIILRAATRWGSNPF